MKNHSKIISLYFISFLLLSSLVMAVTFNGIEILKGQIDPQVVEPGEDFTLEIALWNTGANQEQIRLEVIDQYPFIFKSSSKSLSDFFLCAGCKKTNTYYMSTDHNTITGIYKLRFILTNDESALERTIDIDIKGKSDLILEVLEIPNEIIPNSEFDVIVNVKNQGTGVAKDIKLVSQSSEFLLQGSDIFYLDELNAGESKKIIFPFLSGSDLARDVFSIPILIEFKDHDGTQRQETQSITAKVVNKAELSLKDVKIEPAKMKPGDELTIQIRIENVGEGDAENVKLTLESELEGNKEAYLGRIEKDDDSPAFFEGKILSSGEKEDVLTITYTDDLGEHTSTETLKYTVRGISTTSWIISVLVIIILTLSGILFFSWIYKSCRCLMKGKKCPHLKEHITKTIESVGKKLELNGKK